MSNPGIGIFFCPIHGEYHADAPDSPCPTCEDYDSDFNETIEDGDKNPSWVDRHSVNCYFCNHLFDERDGHPADEFNGNDGGTICPTCLKVRETVD